MSADTYLYVWELDATLDEVHAEADRVWIGQGSGQVPDLYTPAPVAFVTRLFIARPVLTDGLAKSALSCMNMRNESFYGTHVTHMHEGPDLAANWPGLRNPTRSDRSRHNMIHRTRVVHGKAGSPRILTFRSRGVGAGRPVKQFFERNMGKRIAALVD